jgi:hypothetical protein
VISSQNEENAMRKSVRNIKGEHVAFTGAAWRIRRDLQREVRRQGGETTSTGAVNGKTTVLVRGRWVQGDYGIKEMKAAELIRSGQEIAMVADSEFQKLLEAGRPAKVLDRVAGQPIEWLVTPAKSSFENAASVSGPLDYEHSALGRIEQGFLRNHLFGHSREAVCALCGRRLPISLMVAAHIKPRSECSRKERLDADNIVFGVCLLGCDALYERGLISIGNFGKIQVATADGSKTLAKLLGIYRNRACPAWKETSANYFEWHFNRRFRG